MKTRLNALVAALLLTGLGGLFAPQNSHAANVWELMNPLYWMFGDDDDDDYYYWRRRHLHGPYGGWGHPANQRPNYVVVLPEDGGEAQMQRRAPE